MDPKRRLDDESSMQPNSLCRESKDISTIDFANFERGDTEQRKAIGTAITDAFQRQGFLRLINHGISRQTVEELFEWV
jgi:isopenicillin N synthase-like dioxygenase